MASVTLPFAVSAPAATPAPAAGTVYGGSTSKHAPFAITVAGDRRRLSQVLLYVDARCADGTEIPYFARAGFSGRGSQPSTKDAFDRVRLGATGSFRARGTATRKRGGLTLQITHELRGTIRGSKGSGTLKTTMQAVAAGGTRETCSSGTLSWKLRSAPGRVFVGTTRAGGPVVAELNATRRQVSAFRAGWSTTCSAGGFFGLGDELSQVKVGASGAFKDSLEDHENISGGGKRTIAISLSGKVARRTISGAYRHTETDRDSSGKIVDKCDSGALSWRARSS